MIKLLEEFKNRGGLWFFSSNFFERIIRLSLSIFVFSELAKGDAAIWSSALILLASFIPIKSLGIESGILNYANNLSGDVQKSVFKYFLSRGLVSTVLFACICALVAYNKDLEFSDSKILVYILCFALPCSFLYEFLLSYKLILKDHQQYAEIQMFYNLLYVLFLVVGFYFFGLIGFAFAFVLTPLFTFLFHSPKFNAVDNVDWSLIPFKPKEVISYGFKASITNYASELLFYTDLFLIEYIRNDKIGLSDYRVSTIIPLNLGFLAVVYLNNDYVHLVDHKENKPYLISYLVKYFKLYIPFTIIALSLLYFGSDYFWEDLYKSGKYKNSSDYFEILLLASFSIILLRIPAGNILSAIGKVHINTIISYVTLIVNFVLSYFFLGMYGLKGIAIGTVISLTLSGAISFIILYRFLVKK